MRNSLYHIGLEANLWGIFFISNWCGSAQLAGSGATPNPSPAGDPRLYKKAEWASCEGQAGFLHGFCSSSYLRVPVWVQQWTVMWECEPNEPFLSHVYGHDVYHSNRKQTRTRCQNRFYFYFIYICISEPFEWLDVFQAGRPHRVLGKLFTESQGARRLWEGEVGHIRQPGEEDITAAERRTVSEILPQKW